MECNYHGWQFESSGNCTFIPQAEVSCMSTNTCTKRYEIYEQGPMLFVWLGNKPPCSSIKSNNYQNQHIVSTYSRTLPINFTTLLQNVLDPAHIHFAHHGQIGRREWAEPIPIRMLTETTTEGFIADYYKGRVRVKFQPPCLVNITTATGKQFTYYSIPISKNQSRTIAITSTTSITHHIFSKFFIPSWMDHARRNLVIEGDLDLLKSQDFIHDQWTNYCMPTTSDRLVRELRHWLDLHLDPGDHHTWYGHNSSSSSNENTFSSGRLGGHVDACRRCQSVLKRIDFMEKFVVAVAFLNFTAFVFDSDLGLLLVGRIFMLCFIAFAVCRQCKTIFK